MPTTEHHIHYRMLLYTTLQGKISQTTQLQCCTITSSSPALKNSFIPKGGVFSVKLSSIAF